MKAFRILLVLFIVGICVYTISVVMNHGVNLVTPFFSEMLALTWHGQFIFDFQCYLILSGLWVAWRYNFSGKAIGLGLVALIFGILFLAPYLLVLSYKEKGNIKAILLGDKA